MFISRLQMTVQMVIDKSAYHSSTLSGTIIYMDLLAKGLLSSVMLCSAVFSAAQVNCPAVDEQSPPPTALVSSPQIRVQPQPPLSEGILGVPNKIEILVKESMRPIKVELWVGPTGTDVARSYCRLSSDKHGVPTGRYKKFTFKIADCACDRWKIGATSLRSTSGKSVFRVRRAFRVQGRII